MESSHIVYLFASTTEYMWTNTPGPQVSLLNKRWIWQENINGALFVWAGSRERKKKKTANRGMGKSFWGKCSYTWFMALLGEQLAVVWNLTLSIFYVIPVFSLRNPRAKNMQCVILFYGETDGGVNEKVLTTEFELIWMGDKVIAEYKSAVGCDTLSLMAEGWVFVLVFYTLP